MAQSPVNPADSVEDFLARERLLSGELSPEEFASYVASGSSSEVDGLLPRGSAGALLPRSRWASLLRSWLSWQIALAIGSLAFVFSLNSSSLLRTVIFACLAFASLSLSVILLAQSSAMHETRLLTRDRIRLRDEALSYARYADFVSESLTTLLNPTAAKKDSGAARILELLDRCRCALVAAGHEDAALFILRHEGERALLTYSSLPQSLVSVPSNRYRRVTVEGLQTHLGATESYAVRFDLGGHRHELVALSNSLFQAYDRTALRQFAICLSLAGTRSLARG